ncbi:MAG: hypothetical protein IJU18_05770 [Oscillospiraceae bacterium]|nr:hypothetical protein [Oscillospiraceae bacterium]
MNRGVLPHSRILGLAVPIAAMCLMLVIGWFLIFRKNHTLTVEGSTISEKDMMSNRIRTTVSASQIRSVRRNLLGEWLLKDENGKTLLCVESNMSERDLLEVWLAGHGLTVE